jgi:3D (Asp-Asp-Asp) domain-containing protein
MRRPLLTTLALTTLAAFAAQAQAASYSLQRISHYNAVRAQTDRTPRMSACGPTRPGQIALSRDLLRQVGCGARVRVTVNGKSQVYVVNDTMHQRYRRTADILVSRLSTARNLGVARGTLTVLEKGRPYRG